jgi:hypothetical protein
MSWIEAANFLVAGRDWRFAKTRLTCAGRSCQAATLLCPHFALWQFEVSMSYALAIGADGNVPINPDLALSIGPAR